jgi:cytochrome c2
MCHKPHYKDIGRCTACHRGNPDSSRENIAHSGLLTSAYSVFYVSPDTVELGGRLVQSSACRRCHISASKGEPAAVSLDDTAKDKTGEYLADKIKHPNEFMPDFAFSDSEITAIVNYLLLRSASAESGEREPFVTFIKSDAQDVFTNKCGACHRMISRRHGGKGDGDIAANLSGFFSEYFSSDVLEQGRRWDSELLLKWVKNPRSIKKTAVMPPVVLTPQEESELIRMFEK